MALKINVGFSEKLGQPDYGSVGASCNLECELDAELLFRDPERFRQRVQDLYAACTQAVHDELTRRRLPSANGHTPAQNGNGNGNGNGAGNGRHSHGAENSRSAPTGSSAGSGNGPHRTAGNGRQATQSQVRAIHAIAQRQQIDLAALLFNRFSIRTPQELSLADASALIDEMKSATPAGGGER